MLCMHQVMGRGLRRRIRDAAARANLRDHRSWFGLSGRQRCHDARGPPVVAERRSDIHKLAQELRQEARDQLADFLAQVNPFKFEGLVKVLLEEMGYEDVETTAPTHDKGVDVIAHIELGISSVREVIQVKRHKGSLNRTVLDLLRGSLHRFGAVRGTVISTGKFSKGAQEAAFERGAAPSP